MLEIVYKRIKPLLHWDANRLTVEKLKEYADAIYQHGGEEVELEWGIFGFIDGTVCPIARPSSTKNCIIADGNAIMQSSFKV